MEIKNALELHASAKRNKGRKKAESPTNYIYLQSVGQQLTIISVLDTFENLMLVNTLITDTITDFNVKVEVADIKKIIKPLKGDITLTVDGENLIIKTDNKEIKISCTTDIYDDTAFLNDSLFSADTKTLLKYHNDIKSCYYRKYDNNLCQRHMLIDFGKKYIFATDSKQLKLFKNIEDINFHKNEGWLILQSHVLDLIDKCHKSNLTGKTVSVQLTQDNRIVVTTGVTRVFAKMLQPNVPYVDRLINDHPVREVTVNKKELVKVIKKLITVDEMITLQELDNTVSLSVETDKTNVSENIEVISSDNLENFAINFNGALLTASIKSFNGKTLKLGFKNKDCHITIREGDQCYLLMPMRL